MAEPPAGDGSRLCGRAQTDPPTGEGCRGVGGTLAAAGSRAPPLRPGELEPPAPWGVPGLRNCNGWTQSARAHWRHPRGPRVLFSGGARLLGPAGPGGAYLHLLLHLRHLPLQGALLLCEDVDTLRTPWVWSGLTRHPTAVRPGVETPANRTHGRERHVTRLPREPQSLNLFPRGPSSQGRRWTSSTPPTHGPRPDVP